MEGDGGDPAGNEGSCCTWATLMPPPFFFLTPLPLHPPGVILSAEERDGCTMDIVTQLQVRIRLTIWHYSSLFVSAPFFFFSSSSSLVPLLHSTDSIFSSPSPLFALSPLLHLSFALSLSPTLPSLFIFTAAPLSTSLYTIRSLRPFATHLTATTSILHRQYR